MKKFLLFFWILFFTTNSFCNEISFEDHRVRELFNLISKYEFGEAIQFLNNNFLMNFSFMREEKKWTILSYFIFHTFDTMFDLNSEEGLSEKIFLFKSLIDKNNFSDNVEIYKQLKVVLPDILKYSFADNTYADIKLYKEVFKHIKNKLKEDIEASDFGEKLNKLNNDELCSFPKVLKTIIGSYMILENIPSDLYENLCTNEIELKFDQIICTADGRCEVPDSWWLERKKFNKSKNCCTIL